MLAVLAGAAVCDVLLPHPPVVAKAQSAKAKNLVFRFMNYPIHSIGDHCLKLPLEDIAGGRSRRTKPYINLASEF